MNENVKKYLTYGGYIVLAIAVAAITTGQTENAGGSKGARKN